MSMPASGNMTHNITNGSTPPTALAFVCATPELTELIRNEIGRGLFPRPGTHIVYLRDHNRRRSGPLLQRRQARRR